MARLALLGETHTQLLPLSYRPNALAIELNSSKASAEKELSLSRWCIESLHIYRLSSVIDFPSEKYIVSGQRPNGKTAPRFRV